MKKTKWSVVILTALICIILLYLLFWPVAISPQAWTPPAAPELTGQFQRNSQLSGVERLSIVAGGTGFAPEDIAIDAHGRIYAGIDDGRIIRLQADGTHPEVFSNTQGRPLGLVFDSAGNLIVADAKKGLLSISPDGLVSVLATEADGVPFGCTNDLDLAADGTIYFTDASTKFPLSNYVEDLLEHQGTGRLLSFDPKTKTTRTLLKDLCFANGVAVSPDQSFVLVVETGAYRVYRVQLTGGATRGKAEVFIDNLPGFPDGISSNGRDKFWLALVNPRDKALDELLPHPFLRKMVFRLPRFIQPAPRRYSFVLGLGLNGQIVDNLQDGSDKCYARIANVLEHQDTLYLGSIGESAVGRYRLRPNVNP